jgi:hypothetical protein
VYTRSSSRASYAQRSSQHQILIVLPHYLQLLNSLLAVHLLQLPIMPSSDRASSYVKENDIKFGVSVTSRVIHTGVVNGLRCRFCVAFGRELKVGTMRKVCASGQSCTVPFRYDNIENHVCTQHPLKMGRI